MKRTIILCLLSISVIFSQNFKQDRNGFSLHLGRVNSSLLDSKSNSKTTISFGIGYEYYVTKSLSTSSGLFYVEKGFIKKSIVVAATGLWLDNTYNYQDINAKYYFIEIPFILNYSFKISQNLNLKIGSGLSYFFNTNQHDKLENRIIIDTSDLSEEEFNNFPYDYHFNVDPGDMSPESSTFDVNAGIGLELFKCFIFLKYSQTVSEGVTSFKLLSFTERLQCWSLYLGYNF